MIKLQIVSPKNNSAFSDDCVEIKIHAMVGNEHCSQELISPCFENDNKINIIIDDKPITVAFYEKGLKATYNAKVKLKYLTEGLHTIKAGLPETTGVKALKIHDSDVISIIVDRNGPFLHSISPSQMIRKKKDGTVDIFVEAEDLHSGIDAERCTITINNKTFQKPKQHKSGIIFFLETVLACGTHNAKLLLFDVAGNKSEYDLILEVEKTLPYISSVLPSGIVKVEDSNISEIVVNIENMNSGVDVENSTVFINEKIVKDGVKHEKGLTFPIKTWFDDGNYKIKVNLFDLAGNKHEDISEFIIDRSPPVIFSVSPSNAVRREDSNISKITVHAEDLLSGIDLKKCIALIDGKAVQPPSKDKNTIIFPVKIKLIEGVHKMNIEIADLAGNIAKYDTELIIDKTPPVIRSLFFTNMIKVE